MKDESIENAQWILAMHSQDPQPLTSLLENYTAIAASHGGDLSIQIIALLTSIGCAVAGYATFWLGQRESPSKRLCGTLYWISLLTSVIWYVMPFLPQPRFPSLPEGIQQASAIGLMVGLAGTAMVLFYGFQALRTVRSNLTATGTGMRNFLTPSVLLIDGPYRQVRHPMFLGDFLTHLGVCLATGALFTTPLLPLYFAISAGFNLAEERWVLQPRFGQDFKNYQATVPFAVTPRTALAMAVGALLFVIGALTMPSIPHTMGG
ncbi:MAG: methyltransferase [Candidatus Thiodiazotropha sp.]